MCPRGKEKLLDGNLEASGPTSVSADRLNSSAPKSGSEESGSTRRRGNGRLLVTLLGTVLAVPLLFVNVQGNSSQNASLTAFYLEADDVDAAELLANGRAVGGLSADDLVPVRLLGTLSNGDELRAEAEAAALADQAETNEEVAGAVEETPATAPPTTVAQERTVPTPPPTTIPPTTTTTAPPPPPTTVPSSGPTAAQWAALRQCEAGGSYTALNPSGLYAGAYQFHQATWDSMARRTGHLDMVGVRADKAPPAIQDALAQALYADQGSSPWPVCGRHLR